MKKEYSLPYLVHSISALHRLLKLPKPHHRLVSVINFEAVSYEYSEVWGNIMFNFHCIAVKKGCNAKMRYGQNEYDFKEGIMTFTSPKQVISLSETDDNQSVTGYWLILHPDFVQNYPLGKMLKEFGFFSYATNEALHLSKNEETMIMGIMQNIEQEYFSVIDVFSQDVLVSHIELLLNYSNRFYARQFITRKSASNDLLTRFEELLSDCFSEKGQVSGLPSVQYLADQLHMSPNYLSDMLRTLTGQSTQQHIHDKLIEKAKEILSTTNRSVGEIAYQLGFEYPQSFNKLFRTKMNMSPLEFRKSF